MRWLCWLGLHKKQLGIDPKLGACWRCVRCLRMENSEGDAAYYATEGATVDALRADLAIAIQDRDRAREQREAAMRAWMDASTERAQFDQARYLFARLATFCPPHIRNVRELGDWLEAKLK